MHYRPVLPTLFLILGALLVAGCSHHDTSPAVTVYAASSLAGFLEEAGARFQAETGTPVALRLESSSRLARQIQEGAPADVFISAHGAWMEKLHGSGHIEATAILGGNRLAVVVPEGTDPPRSLDELRAKPRVAVGEPLSVPLGIYTREALDPVWHQLGNRVEGRNARAVLALVEQGSVNAGVVYASDAARSERVQTAFLIPTTGHAPIVYGMARVTHASKPDAADAFLRHLQSPAMTALLEKHGLLRATP